MFSVLCMNAREFRQHFGDTIVYFRSQKGLTQENLAFNAGLHVTYIQQIENGHRNPSIFVFYQLAQGLRISMLEIMIEFSNRLNQE